MYFQWISDHSTWGGNVNIECMTNQYIVLSRHANVLVLYWRQYVALKSSRRRCEDNFINLFGSPSTSQSLVGGAVFGHQSSLYLPPWREKRPALSVLPTVVWCRNFLAYGMFQENKGFSELTVATDFHSHYRCNLAVCRFALISSSPHILFSCTNTYGRGPDGDV